MKKRIMSSVLALMILVMMFPISANAMQIGIKLNFRGADEFSLEVESGDSIDNVKKKIKDEKGYSEVTQILMYEGKILDGEKTLADYNIQKQSSLLLTLAQNSDLDESREFSASANGETKTTAEKGETLTFNYTGAQTDENEYVSAMFVNTSDEIVYYGQLKKSDIAQSTVSVNIPSEIPAGKYTLKIFNEKITSDYNLNFRSGFSEFSLEIGKRTVKYEDGKNGEIFTAQVYTAYDGESMPRFEGDLSDVLSYTFNGWDKKIADKVSGDVTYTAKWKNKTSNILRLNGNGGTTSSSSATYNYYTNAVSINAKACPFTKTGYYFTAWNTQADANGTYYQKNETVNFKAIHNGEIITLYAVWSPISYNIVFDSNGADGETDSMRYIKYGTENTLTANAFVKDGYEFSGWNTAADGSGSAYADMQKVSDLSSVNNSTVILYAQWKDVTAPTGEISLGENKWKSFLNEITFGLFFNKTQTVSITASDNDGEEVEIGYLISNSEMSESELDNAEFTEYGGELSLEKDNRYVIYAKLTDQSGNVSYINSNGLVIDSTAPVISGAVDNGKYCSPLTLTVEEENIGTVTVDGVEKDLVNGKFTVENEAGIKKITVKDKAGNISEITVTMYEDHSLISKTDGVYSWKECENCGLTTDKSVIPTNSDGLGAKTGGKTADLPLWISTAMLSMAVVVLILYFVKRKSVKH